MCLSTKALNSETEKVIGMSELIYRPQWQLNQPAQLELNSDGSFPIGEPVGNVFLPPDYVSFMRHSEGAALRDKGSWFLGRFNEGVMLFEIEWLGRLRNLMLATRSYRRHERLPAFYVFIGYAEPGPGGSDVVMNVQPGDPDYGKVFVWIKANDPWMTGDNTRGLGFVANSFNDFMNNLAPKERL
jgi:hypothetical protein